MRTISLRLCGTMVGLGIAFSGACASEIDHMIVGSNKMQELTTDATRVESVAILVPFQTVVHNGEPRKLLVRGEDNLIDQIEIVETAAGKWKIRAPMQLTFEQHEDVEVEIPYVGMVEIRVDSKHVEFADDPATVWLSDAE